MSVFTSGRCTLVNSMSSPRLSTAATRKNASSAAFDAMYAENVGRLDSTPTEELCTMCPDPRLRISGSSRRVRPTAAR